MGLYESNTRCLRILLGVLNQVWKSFYESLINRRIWLTCLHYWGSWNDSFGRNMDVIPSHFIVITLLCTRFFSHHDFSFSLAYVAMPGIQSTPSSLLDGSMYAMVTSPILIFTPECKFQSFPLYGCVAHLMSTVFATSWYTDIRHFTVKLLLNSGSWNDSSGRNVVVSPSHFIVITLLC